MMDADAFFHTPNLRPFTPHQQRRVTWTELFFDLIFVAAVAEAGAPLNHAYSAAGLVRYSFLFILIWRAWSGHTLYLTRFAADDLIQRLLILLQCFIAAVMAANAKEALDSRAAAGFGAAYAGMRVVLVLQYVRALRISQTRELASRYAAGYGAAALLWMGSAFLDAPLRYWTWAAALAADFSTPWLAIRHSLENPPDAAHYPERFGLFTIILLGEFVASVMRGMASQESWSFRAASTAFAGMAFGLALGWWYFDCARAAAERHLRNRRQVLRFQVWQYSHLPLFLGIGVAGVGFERTIALESEARLSPGEAWILCGAAAVVFLALAALGAAAESLPRSRRRLPVFGVQAGAAVAVGGLGAVGAAMNPAALATLLLSACAGQSLLTRRLTRAGGARAAQPAAEWRTAEADAG